MGPIDRDLHKAQALVADANPTTRSVLVAHLRELGVTQVQQCARATDARGRLEAESYDIVICERSFPDAAYNGQDLLDDLRRHGLLPFSTVFIMVTADAGYAQVAEAAESALDTYLLKPCSAEMLHQRIRLARQRKRALRPIFQAIEAGDDARAATLGLARLARGETYGLVAARIGAELLLRAGRSDDAHRAFDAVLAVQPAPWARLGMARAHLGAGRPAEALHLLQQLVAQQPDFADAWDVLARAQIEQGQFDAALPSLRQAATVTPGSVTRQQRLGLLAFQLGQHDEALAALERAVAAGAGSKVLDPLALLLLAVLRYLRRDRKGLQRCMDELQFAHDRQADDARLARLLAIAGIFVAMMNRQPGEAVQRIRALAAGIDQEGFDLEAASQLVMVVSLLGTDELRLEDSAGWIERIGMRHASSKAQAEWLAAAARASAPHARAMHDCHARVLALAEQALSLSLAGDPRGAVLALIGHALRTMNPKLIDTGTAVLQRHRAAVDGADELGRRLDALRGRWGRHDGRVRLGRPLARESGELVLRVATPRAERSGSALAKVA